MSDSTSKEIYYVARSLLPAARSWSTRNTRIPYDVVEDILMDTVVYLIEKETDLSSIQHLPSYLFKSFKNRVFEYLKKNKDNEQLEDIELERLPTTDITNVENNILIDELLTHLDEKSRFIHDYLIRNYKYEEIVPKYNKRFLADVKANLLRSKYNKSVNKLVKLLGTK